MKLNKEKKRQKMITGCNLNSHSKTKPYFYFF